jgi:predicted helicase
MRNAPNKKRGYVILPVVIPTGVDPSEALNDNQTYKVVWEVLQALRSHDDRFDAHINKLDLIGKNNNKMEVIAVTDKINRKTMASANSNTGKGFYGIGSELEGNQPPTQMGLRFEVGEIERALYAKVVKKCGNRNHWEDWAKDISNIAKNHISRIKAIVKDPKNTKEAESFTNFADELRDDLNDSITDDEVIEMLAQHLITKPVFDALFKDYSFATHNPVSQAMQHVLDVLQEHRLDKEVDTLEKFYRSVQMRAEGIDSADGKQKIVVELYDKFFRNAFPRMTERLGIVYTPVEVVDFIIHSVDDVLQDEFGQTLGSEGVHIIDPFTGTGTFITRMLQSGLISKEQLPHKYKHEIHANEIVLLAYYIAAINIEAVYHSLVGGEYQPFEGICLTDTFQLYEKDDMISELLTNNSDRRKRQKDLDIRVIMGNPPYSAGQGSANDNAANVAYPSLDKGIQDTYGKHSKATLQRKLFDSYIRAIRWGSDRIGKSGVMAYVSGSAWIERSFADGLRKCLKEEFSSLYVFHLRGDIRKNMMSKGKAKEGGNIFEQGSMTGIAITIFVKNSEAKEHGNIFFYDIGDDLVTEQKKTIVTNLKSISGITAMNGWQRITPDKHNDWISQRDDSFNSFIELGSKKDKNNNSLFENYSLGISTNRYSWCYNFSKTSLEKNIDKTILFYNAELKKIKNGNVDKIKDIIDYNPEKISWSSTLLSKLKRGDKSSINNGEFRLSSYRPFQKQWLFFDDILNDRRGQIPKVIPERNLNNIIISVSGIGARSGFSVLVTNVSPDIQYKDNGQCFPLYLYEENTASTSNDLFAKQSQGGYTKKDCITDAGLTHFKTAYPNEKISKEDIFYYIYGLLHSEEYRTKYADNLSKQLPRIPCVKQAQDFWAFSKAGRKLADLHINYETVAPYHVKLETGNKKLTDEDYYVTKMKFAKKGDKSKVIYNQNITISNIPVEAYDYVVNGKPALEWVMERQCVKTDKASGIVNDANLYATETVGDAAYPLKLFQSVITVSLETMKIVNSLPKLELPDADNAIKANKVDRPIITVEWLLKKSQELCEQFGYVDPHKIASEIGAVVHQDKNLGQKGQICCNNNDNFEIVVKDKTDHYSVVHEICHIPLHPEHIKQAAVGRKAENSLSKDKETEAENLAALILMPEDFIKTYMNEQGIAEKSQITSNTIISKAAKRFHVSGTAMCIRLKNLGYFISNPVKNSFIST